MNSLTRALSFAVALSAACASTVGGSTSDASHADAALVDAATDAGSCALPNGGRCPVGATCPAGDGCNVCSCYPPGSPTATCTARGCIDAGPPSCRTDAECTGGRLCYFDAPGCDRVGVCAYPRDCANIVPYCGCDGETFRDCPGGTSGRPHRAVGECPVDAGSPDRCAGAHIGRGGQYCAAPDDGTLPLDCCQWNCDTRMALCQSLPPACAGSEVNTVSGACWGPCVPARACLPIACAADGTCPQGWRCNPMERRCVAG